MSENERMIRLIDVQIDELEKLLHNSRGKYSPTQISVLEAEIEGLKVRKNKFKGA